MGALMHTKVGAGLAVVALIAGCAQVLGLQGWTDPPGTGGASSSTGHGTGSGGTGGAGPAGAGAATATSAASAASSPASTTSGLPGGYVDGGTPTCFDSMRDGSESDVDCGGDECQPCAAGRRCNDGADCASGTCAPGGTCAAEAGPPGCTPTPDPSCRDCLQNGLETDVDCGGDDCLPCGADKKCDGDADCLSAHCDDGICATGAFGEPCRLGADCTSGSCDEGACFTGACCH